MPTALEARTAAAFARIDATLGDSFTVTPFGGAATDIVGNASLGEQTAGFGNSAAIVQEMSADYARALIAGRPGTGWRITFASLAGRLFEPVNIRLDESGTRWVFGLKEIKGG